jgi:hypothetical protein
VKLFVETPNAEVEMNLRSLHDSSYVQCKSISIVINETFTAANILNIKTMEFVLKIGDDKPTLYLMADNI